MSSGTSGEISLVAWLVSRDEGKQMLAAETFAQMGAARVSYLIALTLSKVEALPQMKMLAESKSRSPEIQSLQPTACHYMTVLQNSTQAQQLAARR